MPIKKTTPAVKSTASKKNTTHDHSALEGEIAKLKQEVAGLKSALSSSEAKFTLLLKTLEEKINNSNNSASSKDPRFDKLASDMTHCSTYAKLRLRYKK